MEEYILDSKWLEKQIQILTDSTSRDGGEGKMLYNLESWTANITPLPQEPRILWINE